MTGIYVSYVIENPPEILRPNDYLSGIVTVESKEKKDKKLKKLFIKLLEKWEQYYSYRDDDGTFHEGWRKKKNTLKLYPIVDSVEKIKADEIKKYRFTIQMPNAWNYLKKGQNRDWHMVLKFNQKTGLVATRGADKKSAICILPVANSKRTPTFGNPGLVAYKEQIKAQALITQQVVRQVEQSLSNDGMKFCSECGNKIKATAKFCERCGFEFT